LRFDAGVVRVRGRRWHQLDSASDPESGPNTNANADPDPDPDTNADPDPDAIISQFRYR
jgi:hypothetical protein